MEQASRLLRYLSLRLPDVVMNKVCFEFQEKKINKEIREAETENVLKVLQDFSDQVDYIKSQMSSMQSVQIQSLKEFRSLADFLFEHLNLVLRHCQYRILYGAVEDIVRCLAIDNKLPHKIVNIIFMVANGTFKAKTKIINTVVVQAKPLFQVNIDEKRRLYYIRGENIIVGLDIERNYNDHSDVLRIIENRFRVYAKEMNNEDR